MIRWRLVMGSGGGIVLVVLFGAFVHFTHRVTPFAFDQAANDWMTTQRTGWLTALGLFFNAVGAGIIGDLVVPGVILIALLVARKWRQAVIVAGTLAVSALSVQILKMVIERARPTHGLIGELSQSYPSGHAAQAATLAVVLAIVLRSRWIAVVGTIYAVSMAASRVYLGVHWTTDVIAGLVLGASFAILAYALFARDPRPGVPGVQSREAPLVDLETPERGMPGRVITSEKHSLSR
jgi:membrane-associated phospholipid phosphatase